MGRGTNAEAEPGPLGYAQLHVEVHFFKHQNCIYDFAFFVLSNYCFSQGKINFWSTQPVGTSFEVEYQVIGQSDINRGRIQRAVNDSQDLGYEFDFGSSQGFFADNSPKRCRKL